MPNKLPAMIAAVSTFLLLLAAGLAGWFSHWALSKLNWNQALAVIVAVMLGAVLGLVMSFLSTVISIPIAGIR